MSINKSFGFYKKLSNKVFLLYRRKDSIIE